MVAVEILEQFKVGKDQQEEWIQEVVALAFFELFAESLCGVVEHAFRECAVVEALHFDDEVSSAFVLYGEIEDGFLFVGGLKLGERAEDGDGIDGVFAVEFQDAVEKASEES